MDVVESARQTFLSLQGSYHRSLQVGVFGTMRVDRTIRLLAMGALLASALALGGCSTSVADLPGVGLPTDAPARPKEVGAYLPVHDLPPERDEAAMKPAEQKKIQSELIAARDRQAVSAGAPGGAAK
jgi:hypothetical protein